ncbi:MAG TPA: ATP-binding protein, partial [Steroidobacteraceae bacterium]|nr:ATP-binding protein [Steroidobacteraceae bacterium]
LMITQRVDQDVPLQIEADSERLRQVLTNLIGNAIKFTLEGGIAVTLSKVIAGDKVRLRCEVRDTGIGIASDEQTRLFQPFSQVENSAARRFGGAGLGLAISRQLIEAMHGELGLESHLGQGSMFWFSVPVGAIDTASNNESQIDARAVPELSARVLVVEDTEHNRELIVDMLTLAGCTVHAVISGAEALQVLRTEKFDAVIMDWHMPELDGLQAIRLLRERERVAKVVKPLRIIALTGSAMPGDRETCLAAGADDYLSKPFTLDALLTVVGKQTR